MTLMKRKIAAGLGLVTYENDSIHLVCGTYERYVSTGNCVECGKRRRSKLPSPKQLFSSEDMPETREAAIAMDSKFYKPTTPCKNGHLSRRYTRTCVCVRCNQVAASKVSGTTPDSTKRAAGLVRVESWVYPDQVERIGEFERMLLSEHNRQHPPGRPMPTLPGADRHPDDYDMK